MKPAILHALRRLTSTRSGADARVLLLTFVTARRSCCSPARPPERTARTFTATSVPRLSSPAGGLVRSLPVHELPARPILPGGQRRPVQWRGCLRCAADDRVLYRAGHLAHHRLSGERSHHSLRVLAFNLDLVNGNGSPGSGALAPVSQAIHNLYTSTFGTPWLIAMVTLVGCWAMWKALVQRRYTETAGALAVSLLYFVLAIGIVTQPERTIGPASKLSNQLSTALLSLTSQGSISRRTTGEDRGEQPALFNSWCWTRGASLSSAGSSTAQPTASHSVAVRPLSGNANQDTQLASQLEAGTEVHAQGKTCINDRDKYASHFLAYEFQSKERNSEHEALEKGDTGDLPSSDPGKRNGTYKLGKADEPAAEAMDKGGQYQRMLLSIVILLGELGAFLLLGALALGVILAQLLLLLLLSFAPVALLIGIFPGRGHDFFPRVARQARQLPREEGHLQPDPRGRARCLLRT